jgi:SAM-dependent methyltransferase
MFHEESYKRQSEGFSEDLTDAARKKISASWFDKNSADYWRHARAYAVGGMLRGERWLTVGDGRFGLDAIRLQEAGAPHVLATDLTETLLKESKARGLIQAYSVENAEHLSFADKTFDYVFCKEAFHHFPRPAIALYEMLRVARKGVILVEPNDRIHAPVRIAKAAIKTLLGRGQHMDKDAYEEDGNYVFSISRREMEKIALGINLPQVAFRPLNDFYAPGLEFAPLDSSEGRKMRSRIAGRDMLCRLGLDSAANLMAGLFHQPLAAPERAALEATGWDVIDLPRNPHHPAQ